ncbi:uncharacterized protein LOC128986585 [Macrosteles quadrilineatus]|uniref:uncharacterized protein LOC128986585 n=1 Tax=Macrosteles quadrilineatus TaxID=74068 RepID=UPI0023E0FA2D|nr:uncharacterized protein LOC128986585 [Macrosteles quadrilineatus]
MPLQKHYLIGICVLLVAAAVVFLVFLFKLEEEKPSPKLRTEVYAHLDKICKDVNSLDKIQIAIYFLMQSWLTMCDATPDTVTFAPLKFMKKRIHDSVTKKIQEFHKKDEQSVEDCIITYYNTEIKSTEDDFHKMLFELVLQGYMKTFTDNIVLDESNQFLKMEMKNCNATDCQYSFPKPPSVPQMIDVIIKKSQDEPEDVQEKKCVQVFQHLFIWNEKIKKPEWFEWSYYLLFKGVEKTLNITEIDVKQNLHCASSQMQAMERAITAKPDDINPFLVTFLRERDVEIEVLEDEIEYAEESAIADSLNRRLKVQSILAELVLKTYMEMFDITPTDGRFTVITGGGPPVQVEVPPMENISSL